jgi:hypothetical protein
MQDPSVERSLEALVAHGSTALCSSLSTLTPCVLGEVDCLKQILLKQIILDPDQVGDLVATACRYV